MKPRPSNGRETSGSCPTTDAVDQAAATWRARLDAGLSASEERDFNAWLEADLRHAEAFSQMDVTWSILDRASELSPAALGEPDDLPARHRSAAPLHFTRKPWWLVSVLSAAAAIVVTLVVWSRFDPRPGRNFTNVATVGPELVKRINLPDGSTIRLNSESSIRVRFSDRERRVTLERGEASFSVAKESARPFIVTTAGVDVRAVGTAFNVAFRSRAVEVLVTEGKVRVNDTARGQSLLLKPVATGDAIEPSVAAEPSPLSAGEKVTIEVETTAAPIGAVPVAVAPEEVAAALAWQERRLEFNSTPLSDIAAEFNRYNQHQIVVLDPALGRQRIGGSFRADDPDTFVQLIETRSGVVVEKKATETIIRTGK